MNEPEITVIGQLGGDPELRFTPGGDAVVNFTVAMTPKTKDKTTGEWKDGETLWLRCSAWREFAENIAESLTRGMRVIVQGRLKQRSYTTKEGVERTSFELDVTGAGPELRFATASVSKTERRGDGGGNTNPRDPAPPRAQQQQQPQQQAPRQQPRAPQPRQQSRGPRDPQGGPPTHEGWGQSRPAGAQEPSGDPWATNPQGKLPDGQQPQQQGSGMGEGWGQAPTYPDPPF